MNFSQLIQQRSQLLRQTRLANVAYAYHELTKYSSRIARAKLRGEVELRESDAETETYWATLTAIGLEQSVIEEHFTDDEIIDIADLIAFATDADVVLEQFRLEDMHRLFAVPLRKELLAAGIATDDVTGGVVRKT
jgi:hypothetical protein